MKFSKPLKVSSIFLLLAMLMLNCSIHANERIQLRSSETEIVELDKVKISRSHSYGFTGKLGQWQLEVWKDLESPNGLFASLRPKIGG